MGKENNNEEQTSSANNDRQRRWRSKQEADGLIQARVWIPSNRQRDLTEVAAAWRSGKPGKTPTPKQLYDMNKLLKSGRYIPGQYQSDGYLLEIWIAREKARKRS